MGQGRLEAFRDGVIAPMVGDVALVWLVPDPRLQSRLEA